MRPLALLALALVWPATAVRADDSEHPDGPPKKQCVSVSTEANYVNYGYEHVVKLRSACDKPQRCTVKTDVAPGPVAVELAVGEAKSVVTYRGSPSREFKADVSCQPAG